VNFKVRARFNFVLLLNFTPKLVKKLQFLKPGDASSFLSIQHKA
jgi:hypothetical protein